MANPNEKTAFIKKSPQTTGKKMKNNIFTKTLITTGLLFAINGAALGAGNYNSSIQNEAPSSADITTAKRALVWCTNNLQKIQQKKMDKNQVITATDRYYSKRKDLEDLPNLMNHKPNKKEMPSLPGSAYDDIYTGKTFGEIIRMCDAGMVTAKNKFMNEQFKPSNIAEEKIATYYEEEVRKAMMKEQQIGKDKGFEGIFYGVVDSLTDIQNGKFTGETLSKFLIKPSKYDDYWRLTNIKKDFVAYEMFAGESIMIIVKRNPKEEYLDMAKLHDGYYQITEFVDVQIEYEGTVRDTVLPVLEKIN
ncbi:MAG: hypothetical protein L3J00_08160 [Thiomicrorhabdus sp.]|nr:hypothetical protein [Thiomicrorhabdus sp.]